MERKKYQESLESRITQFIDEGVETRRLSIKRAARLHYQLVGSSAPFIHVGYVWFLKARGVAEPKMSDLCGFLIGRYWEFITQHHGTIASEKAMTALRAFWIWCSQSNYITPQRLPADLSPHMRVAKPYRVKIKISETK